MISPNDVSQIVREELRKHLEDLRDIRSEIPSLALIYPQDQHYLKSGFIGQKWALRLCCMFPAGEHPLEAPENHKEGETNPALGIYYLEDLGELTGPIIKWMSSKAKIAKVVFPRLGGFFEWVEKNEVTSFLKSAGEKAKDISLPESHLPRDGKFLPISSEYITLAGLNDRDYREIEGQGLIFLQQVIQKHGRCGNLSLFVNSEGRMLWLCREHEALMKTEREAAAVAAGRRMDELWSQYRERLSANVSKVRLLGESDWRELKQVFVNLNIVEEYQRPSARNEWMGFVDPELRRRRALFSDTADEEEDEKKKEKRLINPEELLRDGTRAIITGAPGCGKSTLLRWLAGRCLNNNAQRLPVFLELKSINKKLLNDCGGNLADLLFEQSIVPLLHFADTEERATLKSAFICHLAANRVAIFLDGLDEVHNTDFFAPLCEAINLFLDSTYGWNLLLISTRPYALDVRFRDAREMEVAPLNHVQVTEFLKHYYGADPKLDQRSLLQQIGRRELSQMVRVPVLLGALVRRYREKGELTGDRLKLYEDLVHDLVVTRDAESNVERFKIEDEDGLCKLEFLEQVAFKKLFDVPTGRDNEPWTFTTRWLFDEAKDYCPRFNIKPQDFVADVKATALLREVAKGVWAFSHLTIQEYLAARALAGKPDCERIFCRNYFNPTLVEMESMPMALGLVSDADKYYRMLEELPDSLNLVNVRLRARGLSYVRRLSDKHHSSLVSEIIGLIFARRREDLPYADSVFHSLSVAKEDFLESILPRIQLLIRQGYQDVRLRAIGALGLIGREQTIPLLIRSLRGDKSARNKSVEALKAIGGESVVAELLRLLQDGDADIRKIALFAISDIGGALAVERLLELVCRAEESEETPVIKALLETTQVLERISMGGHLLSSLQDLVDEEDDGPKGTWLSAVLTLFHLEGKSGLAQLLAILRNDHEKSIDDLIVNAFVNRYGDSAAERLLAVLRGNLWLAREQAGRALTQVNNDCIIPGLIEIIVTGDNWTDERAAAVLIKIGRRGDKRAADALLPLLDSGDAKVRSLSAKLLGLLRAKEMIPKLIHMLRTDPDEGVRSMVAVGLMWSGYNEVASELADVLHDPNDGVRRWVVEALANVPDERAISLLRQALQGDIDKGVRGSAAKALGKLKAQTAAPDLLSALGKEVEQEVRYAILEALGEIGGARSCTELAIVLKNDPDESARRRAAEALGKLGGERATLALLDALEHDEVVRSSAQSAFECLKYEAAVDALAKVLVSGNHWVGTMAASATLNTIGSRAASELTAALARVDNLWLPKKVAEALSELDDAVITNGLIINLSSQRMTVKRMAAGCIGYYSRSDQVLQLLLALSSDSEAEETCSAARTAIWKLRRLPKEFLPEGIELHEPEGPYEPVKGYPSQCSLADTLSDPLAEMGPEVFTAVTSATTHDDAHYNLVVMLAERGAADEAESELRAWVRCSPLSCNARHCFGWFLNNQGRSDEAEREYLEAIRLDPQASYSHNNLGMIYEQDYKYEAAEQEFREAIRCDPDFVMARRNLGSLLIDLGRLDEAEAELREACRIDPNDSEALFQFSRALGNQGRFEEAKSSYLKHSELFGASGATLNNLGLLHERQGCDEEAEKCFRQSIERDPDLIQPHRNLKALLLRTERVAEAESELRRWIHHGDTLSEFHNDLAQLLAGQGRADEAVEIYREWLVCEPDNTASFPYLINILVKQDRMAEAETACRNWVEKNDEDRQANSSLWSFLTDCGRVAEALNEYLRWMSSGGDKGWASRHFAETLIEKGFAKEAEKVLLDAVQHHPTTLSYHSDLAKFYAGQGRLEDAVRVFRNWLAEHRGDSEAHFELGILFAEAGHMGEAEGELIESLKCYDAENEIVPFFFIWSVESAYMKRERYAEGAAILTEIIRVKSDMAEAHISRGTLYWYGGSLREALSDFNRALELAPENGLTLNSRGQVLAELEEYDAAIIDLKKAIELDERDNALGVTAYALSGLAFALGAKGEMNEAMQLFQKSISLSPENAWVYFNRGIIQAHSGNTVDAESDFILSLKKAESSLPRRKREAALSYLLHLRGDSNSGTTDN